MSIGDIRSLIGIGAVVVAIASYGWSMDNAIKGNKQILEELNKRQQEIVDWKSEEIRRRQQAEAQRELLRQLCATGQVTDQKLCDQVRTPPMAPRSE